MSSRFIRSALRAEADAHQPDRAAILDRIHRGQAALDPRRAPRATRRRTVVAAGMAAIVAAVLGLGVAVTWAAVRTETPHKSAQGAPATATAGPATTSTPAPGQAPGHDRTSHVPSGVQASRSPEASPGSPPAARGPIWSSGAIDPHSIDNWAQGNVMLGNRETITALEVRVRVVLTPYVSSTGQWSTIPTEDVVMSVARQPDALEYTFTLKPGVRLAPGSYTFAVQYGHATGGRDPSRDSYRASVTVADGTRVDVNGGF